MRYLIAEQLLEEELRRLENDHFSDRLTDCDGCLEAYRARRELESLRALPKRRLQHLVGPHVRSVTLCGTPLVYIDLSDPVYLTLDGFNPKSGVEKCAVCATAA